MEKIYLNAHYGMLLFLLQDEEKVQEVLAEMFADPLLQNSLKQPSYIEQVKCINQVILHKNFATREELLRSYRSFMNPGRNSDAIKLHQVY